MIISVLLNHSLSSSDKLSLIIPQIIAVLIILFLILPLHESWPMDGLLTNLGTAPQKMQED